MIRTALASVLALVAPAQLATAETITVCPDGCDFVNINPAIAAADDGDVIQLAATTYALFNTINTLVRKI